MPQILTLGASAPLAGVWFAGCLGRRHEELPDWIPAQAGVTGESCAAATSAATLAAVSGAVTNASPISIASTFLGAKLRNVCGRMNAAFTYY